MLQDYLHHSSEHAQTQTFTNDFHPSQRSKNLNISKALCLQWQLLFKQRTLEIKFTENVFLWERRAAEASPTYGQGQTQ